MVVVYHLVTKMRYDNVYNSSLYSLQALLNPSCSGIIWRRKTLTTLDQVTICLLLGIMPLSETMRTCFIVDPFANLK